MDDVTSTGFALLIPLGTIAILVLGAIVCDCVKSFYKIHTKFHCPKCNRLCTYKEKLSIPYIDGGIGSAIRYVFECPSHGDINRW